MFRIAIRPSSTARPRSRTAAGTPTEFQNKHANTDGRVRYTAPSIRFTNEQGTTLEAVVRALNALGASPRDIIAIMQGLKAAGALQAELVIL